MQKKMMCVNVKFITKLKLIMIFLIQAIWIVMIKLILCTIFS